MTISQTVLGPNTSSFTFTADETTTTIMAAIDSYVTGQGWTVYDNAAPQGIAGTSPVGRIYTALQDGSTATYKYVGIAINTTSMQIKIYESWNASTHAGTNEGTYYNNGNGLSIAPTLSLTVGTAGAGYVLFANAKWLGVRTVSAAGAYSHFMGAFEIRKDYGEADSTVGNIFMTSLTALTTPATSAGYLGLYGCCHLVSDSTKVGSAASTYTNISTPFGAPFYNSASNSVGNMLPTSTTNGATTMTAIEMANAISSNQVKLARGRILGIKLAYGSTNWNDMDSCSLKCDSDFFESGSGNVTNFTIINPAQATYVRYLIPA